MYKIQTIKGCADCPNLHRDYCLLLKQSVGIPDGLNTLVIPETPHPDCQLPSLPTDEEIETMAKDAVISLPEDTKRIVKAAFQLGATSVINKIIK